MWRLDVRDFDRALDDQVRVKRVTAKCDLHWHESHAFLQHDRPRSVHTAHACEHRGGADGGMSGELHLALRRKDAHVGGVLWILGRQDEGGLGEVELARDRLHGAVGDAAAVGKDRELVAGEGAVGEDVGDEETVGHRNSIIDACDAARSWG